MSDTLMHVYDPLPASEDHGRCRFCGRPEDCVWHMAPSPEEPSR